ncbi:MAG: LysR family transcriptional regulator [Myxococcales bacterium]|nr:LysR family transcriptional regulator [Myxococcales bacterium]
MDGIDLRQLDLNLLVALDRLLERGSVGAAARDLGISQPAMSRTLQRLRDTLGDPLFVRAGRGLVPTDHARTLREPVTEALRAFQRVFAPPPTFDPATATGPFTIAMGDEAQVAFADGVAAAIWRAAPGIDVRIRPLSAASLDEGRRGLLDLAVAPDLGPLPPTAGAISYREFVVRPLYTRRWVVAGARGRWRMPLGLEEWLAADHAIVSFDGGGRGFVDDLVEARGLRRRVAVSLTSFVSVARLLARSELLAVIPEEVVRTVGEDLVCGPPPIELPELRMLAIWHPARTTDPRNRFLREVVSDVIRERAAPWDP